MPPTPTHSHSERLDELAAMEDGWYWHGEGKAPTVKAIEIARSFIDANWHIYPTLAGGVSLEADDKPRNLCLQVTIGPRGRVHSWTMSTASLRADSTSETT